MSAGARASRQRTSGAGTVLWWLLYAGIYLAFISGVTWQEGVAAAFVAAGAVGLSRLAVRAAGLRFAGGLPHLWRLPAVLRTVGCETSAVTVALARHLSGRRPVRGRFVAIPVPGEVDGATDAAVTIEASIAPNTYVVGLVEGKRLLLVHQLEPRSDARRSFPRWSG